MATIVEIGGVVHLPIGGEVWLVEWIEYRGRAWLTPLWIASPDGKWRRPLRIIAPKFAPGHTPPPGPAILEIFQEMPLPASLLEKGVIPEELASLVEVHENPDIIAAFQGEGGLN